MIDLELFKGLAFIIGIMSITMLLMPSLFYLSTIIKIMSKKKELELRELEKKID